MGQGLLYIKHKRLFAFKWCKVDMRLTRGSLNLPFEKVHSNIKNKNLQVLYNRYTYSRVEV